MRTVIHRDHTFTYDGRTYRLLYGGPGWGYEIIDDDGRQVADGFSTLAAVRAHVDEARREGWDLEPDRPTGTHAT